jgi:environmental stress-induced protein Ves
MGAVARTLKKTEYRPMPWRNGGGVTTEIVVGREGLASDDPRFVYRVSIADVASDGPFSRFDGYDRHIMLLEGQGMTLDAGPHGTIDLRECLRPRSFSGDWDVRGTLVGGPVRDYNVIVDRARASATLAVHTLDAPLVMKERGIWIVHVLDGALVDAALGETLYAPSDCDEELELRPRGTATVAASCITLRRS